MGGTWGGGLPHEGQPYQQTTGTDKIPEGRVSGAGWGEHFRAALILVNKKSWLLAKTETSKESDVSSWREERRLVSGVCAR